MELNRCSGFSDLTSEEMPRFRFAEDIFLLTSAEWGYEEIRTPTLEYLHLFTQAGTLTPGMLRRAYSFLDWDGWTGSRVVMRPDNTIPAVRYYIDAYGEGPARLSYSAPIYVFDVDENKNRERLQFGCELIGSSGSLADTELIKMSIDILQRLGAEKIKIKLSHAGVVRAALEYMGLNSKEREDVFDAILNGKQNTLRKAIKDQETYKKIETLLSVNGKTSSYIKNIAAVMGRSGGVQSRDLIDLCDMLSATDVDFEVDFTVGKGFEYYTGMMFRIFADGKNVGGGGRYDRLIPTLGGDQTPAAGFALYVDHLMAYIDSENLSVENYPKIQIVLNNKKVKESFDVASYLRDEGYSVVMRQNDAKSDACCCSCCGNNFCVYLQDDDVYVLEDCADNSKKTVNSAEDLVKLLAGVYE